MRGIYVLHYDRPLEKAPGFLMYKYGGPIHYVGKSKDMDTRIMFHRIGHGSRKTVAFWQEHIWFSETKLDVPDTVDWEEYVTWTPEKFCGVCLLS